MIALASMLAEDEDALTCDFAEVYRIYDVRSLPAGKAAVLACGLGPDSRIGKKMDGRTIEVPVLLQAAELDTLRLLLWIRTKDGEKGRNRPKSVLEALMGGGSETTAYHSAEAFDSDWERIAEAKRKEMEWRH